MQKNDNQYDTRWVVPAQTPKVSERSSSQINKIFVYNVNVKNKTIQQLIIIADTDASMIYREEVL